MKKFYTLLSVALFAAGSLSAASLKTAVTATATNNAPDAETALEIALTTAGKTGLKSVAPRIKDPNATENSMAGNYVVFATGDGDLSDNATEDTRTFKTAGSVSILENGKDSNGNDAFILRGLFGADRDINASITESTPTADGTLYTLEIPANTTLFEENGNIFTLCLYGNLSDDGKEYVFTGSPFKMLYNPKNNILFFYYTRGGAFVGYEKNKGFYGNVYYSPEFDPANAVMKSEALVDPETNTYAEKTDYLIMGISEQDNILLYNMAGASELVELEADHNNKTAVAKNQVYQNLTTQTATIPFYIKTAIDANTNEVTATIGADPATNQTTLTFGNWGAYGVIEGSNYYAVECKSSVITFDNNIYGEPVVGGLADVIADSDANAPVEYYNLQGIRIANPEAGQLLIKRQGKTVSKIVVR